MVKTIFDNPSDILSLMRNCVFIKDGDVWYRDFEREIPLVELARKLNKAYSDSNASAVNDEAFSDKMYDDLQFKPEEDIDSFIATFLYGTCWNGRKPRTLENIRNNRIANNGISRSTAGMY